MESLTIGIIFGLLGMLGFGLSNGVAKIPAERLSPARNIFFRTIVTSMTLLLVVFFFPLKSFPLWFIPAMIAIVITGYIPLATFYRALEVGKVGIISPIANSATLFTVLFSIIFFSERPSAAQWTSICLIILGIMLISLDFRDLKKSALFSMKSGIPFALITCFLWGTVFFLWKFPVNIYGPIMTAFLIEFGGFLSSVVHVRMRKEDFSLPSRQLLKYIFFVGLFGACGTLFYNLGIQWGPVSLVSAITFSNPAVAVLYGAIMYKEKLKLQQYLAILLILIGIVLISYF